MSIATATSPQTYLPEVRNQYEDLPYPPRNPEDERETFFCPVTEQLDRVNHYCYGGTRDFLNKKHRYLVAGCGTGDAVIYLGEQLHGTDSEIIAMDLSTHSLAICKERARIRKLKNITFMHASLLDIPTMDIGQFDFINSSGVLHHLADPNAGLKALASVLKDDGAMSIMVYGQIGRTGIYYMQEALRQFFGDDITQAEDKITASRALMRALPKSNWLAMNNALFIREATEENNSGLYDLFLHSQDRGYTVPDIYDWLGDAGLELADIVASDSEGKSGRTFYNPLRFLKDQKMIQHVSSMSEERQQAMAELMQGNIVKHNFYAMTRKPATPALTDEMIITLSSLIENWSLSAIADELEKAQMNAVLTVSAPLKSTLNPQVIRQQYTANLLRSIDSKRSVSDIITHVIDTHKLNDNEAIHTQLRSELAILFNCFNIQDILFLRHPSVPPYNNGRYHLQTRAMKRMGVPLPTKGK